MLHVHLRSFKLAQVVQARGNVVDNSTPHGGIPGAACLLGDGEAMRKRVKRLFVLLPVEQGLGLRKQLPLQALQRLLVHIGANLCMIVGYAVEERR